MFENGILQKYWHETRAREIRNVATIFMRKHLEKNPF
jgi:hypothetical protein